MVLVRGEPQCAGQPELPDVSAIGSSLAIGSATVGVGLLRMSWSRHGGRQPWLTAVGWMAFLGGAAAWHGAGLGWDEAVALGMLGPSLIAFVVLARYAQWRPTAAGAGRGRRRSEAQRPAGASVELSALQLEVWRTCLSALAQGSWISERSAPSSAGAPIPVAAQAPVGSQVPADVSVSAGTTAVSRSGVSLGSGVVRVLLAGPGALATALGLTGLVALRAPWLEADRLVAAGFVLPVAWAVGAIWATMDRRIARVAVGLGVTAIVCVGGAVA